MLEYAGRVVKLVELLCGGTGYTLALLIGRSLVAFFYISDSCKSLRTYVQLVIIFYFIPFLLHNQCS